MRKETLTIKINRRTFLKVLGAGVGGVTLGGVLGRYWERKLPEVTPEEAKIATPTEQPATKITTGIPTTPETATTLTTTLEPTTTATPEVNKMVVEEIILTNIPKEINENVVDIAKGEFENKTGVAPHVFAEPGGLLVEPDFGYADGGNPWGNNPNGWETMHESEGSIQVISPVNQEVIRWPETAYQNLPEGGFVFFSGGKMTVELGEIVIEMPGKGPGHNYFFVARGFYPDGKQDTDRNIQVKITDYIPGHIEVTEYQSRDKTNLAFISEEHFLQKVATSHSSGTNCGAEGCSDLILVALDANTGALEIYNHKQQETEGLEEAITEAGKNWQLVYSNYRKAK